MLAEKRFRQILQRLETNSFVTIDELASGLGVSESTIRRDLSYLDSEGMLKRIHGGATTVNLKYGAMDESASDRRLTNMEQKLRIARYAASLVKDDDFIFVDAGTTTELMIQQVEAENVVCATNSLSIATIAVTRCKKVFLIGGEFKSITEACVGPDALEGLKKYNFAKGFFGANAVDVKAGYTTPDVNEAMVKRQALLKSIRGYVLADASKMYSITSFTFGEIDEATLITTQLPDDCIQKIAHVVEVDKLT